MGSKENPRYNKPKTEKTVEYNERYYSKHREDILAQKRNRYRTDEVYRQSVIAKANERKKRLADEKRIAKAQGTVFPRKSLLRAENFIIQVGRNRVSVEMFTVGHLARVLHRSVKTIYSWEEKRTFPFALYRKPERKRGMLGDRLYTGFQVEAVKSAYRRAIILYGPNIVRYRLGTTGFFSTVNKLWKDYPLGVDPDDIGG